MATLGRKHIDRHAVTVTRQPGVIRIKCLTRKLDCLGARCIKATLFLDRIKLITQTLIGHPNTSTASRIKQTLLSRACHRPNLATTRFDIKLDNARLVLIRSDKGIRVVSRKRRGESEYPVIDINSRELLEMFEGMSAVRVVMLEEEIHILPLATELRRQERVERTAARMGQGDPLEIGSLSHGGGIMCHAIHAGLYREGLDSRLVFANEIRPELLDHARDANDCWESDTVGIAAPMQELAFDRWAMAQLPAVDILEAGIPCSGASLSGRSKRKLGVPEDHPEVGHLVVAFLAIVAAVNPLALMGCHTYN
ncbi:MAG: hypothetical protein R6W97_06345 [Thiobacillus sp.]